jgi:uncharacterized protein YggT (Ycf19 family)
LTLLLASAREDIAGYVSTLVWVYSLLILVYILSTLFFSFGGRIPYSRWSSALIGFLHDVSEPYLRIFRRFIPPIGPLDISPILALLVLSVVGNIVVRLIRGY